MGRRPRDTRKDAQSAPVVGTHTAAPGGPDRPAGDLAPLPEAVEPEQLALDELLPRAIFEAERRGPGRPKGSVNIRTNTTFQAAVSRYGDPLIASVAMGNMDTKALIRHLRAIASDCGLKLGATVMDIVRFQEDCRRNAMPFGHAKRAATDEKGDTVVPVIGIGRAEHVVVQAAGRSIEDELAARQAAAKTVEHQGDSDDEGE